MFKVVIDSCGEFTPELKNDARFVSVPLELEIDGHRVVDDETFDQLDFLKRVRESEDYPRSSCPSPGAYVDAYEGSGDDDNI